MLLARLMLAGRRKQAAVVVQVQVQVQGLACCAGAWVGIPQQSSVLRTTLTGRLSWQQAGETERPEREKSWRPELLACITAPVPALR